MRALAAELREKIDGICIEYHYFKNENVIEKAKEIIPTIQKYCTGFLQGNSYGISEEEYYDAIHKSFDVDNTDEVVIEPFIKGREFACGILAGKALPLVEIVPKDGLFDYANKYQAGGASEICPPVSLDEETQELIQRAGERAFEALRMDVYSRADFIVSDADGEFYCLEMNALPGMTAASLLPKAAKAAGYEYSELCEAIIQESIKARY